MAEKYKLLVFNSTHHAFQAEKILTEKTDSIMMVPVPPEISADCGLAIKLTEIEKKKIIDLIQESDIKTTGLYQVTDNEPDKRIKKLN